MNVKRTINFTKLAPEALLEVFIKHQVTFPRSLRIKVLLELIEPKYIEERTILTKKKEDEPSEMTIKDYIRLNRLIQYNKLSEFQLESDYDYYNDANLNKVYFNTLWDEYVTHIEKHPYCKEVFEEIEELEIDENKKELSVYKCNLAFSSIITDEDDYFDGVYLAESVTHFDSSSVATEIKKLGEKYDIKIPKHWKKLDMQAKLTKELKSRKLYNDDYELKIQESSVKVICSMLDDLKVDSKVHLTKKDMVNTIIRNVDKNKISEISIKDMEEVVDEIEPVIEEVIPEPVPEPVPEVLEVEKVVESVVIQQQNQIDYTYLLQQIIDNQEIIMVQSAKKKVTFLEKVFNYIVAFLIVLVVILWVVFAVLTF